MGELSTLAELSDVAAAVLLLAVVVLQSRQIDRMMTAHQAILSDLLEIMRERIRARVQAGDMGD